MNVDGTEMNVDQNLLDVDWKSLDVDLDLLDVDPAGIIVHPVVINFCTKNQEPEVVFHVPLPYLNLRK